MKIIVVALRDIKGNIFGPPQVVAHIGGAIRSFQDSCEGKGNQQDQTLALHPEDFELFQLGFYDDQDGTFTNDKQQIAVGSNFKRA